ncbi:hypothetical protein AB0B25_27040 [Nocardia sp. NPDC049190]|uniref:hypothetical protein n=1 Tax=Nocardia sp. NPDC049190 TaxID=3155650 RepID=UPI0033FA4126
MTAPVQPNSPMPLDRTEIDYPAVVANLLDSLLRVPEHRAEIEYLQHRLSVSREEIIAAWLFYDLSITSYSNEAYSSTVLRLAMHLHNSLVGNWHDRRQATVVEYLSRISPTTICEIGFGTPQRYVREFLGGSGTAMALCEYDTGSLEFAATVLEHWRPDWADSVTLLRHSMDDDPLPSGYSVYIFQDSIEHALRPTETLRSYVDGVPVGTHFIFSLPVEVDHPIPGHHISWTEENAVIDWLSTAGLTVLDKEVICFRSGLDLHSHCLHPDTRQLVTLAVKKGDRQAVSPDTGRL